MLMLIRDLYAIESEIPSLRPGLSDTAREEILRLRAKRREERSTQQIARIRDWAYTQRALPQSGLGKAIRYVLKYWRGLTVGYGIRFFRGDVIRWLAARKEA